MTDDKQPAKRLPELVVGSAAEHIVCADLLLAGFVAFRTEQACAFDVVADVGGALCRVQVKGTLSARPYPQAGQRHVTGYVWTCRRGKGANRPYREDEFDVLALVALDVRRVAYLANRSLPQLVQIAKSGQRTPGLRSFDSATFADALAATRRT